MNVANHLHVEMLSEDGRSPRLERRVEVTDELRREARKVEAAARRFWRLTRPRVPRSMPADR